MREKLIWWLIDDPWGWVRAALLIGAVLGLLNLLGR